jgi:sterol 3beta-glucosyltransferase
MRMTVIALGTRGDVTPFVALALRLRAEGHSVRIATHRDFGTFVERYGLEFYGLPGSYQDFVASPQGRHALGVPDNSVFGVSGIFLPFQNCAEALYDEGWAASADADAIICSPIARMAAELIAGKRDLPIVLGLAALSVPTRSYPHPVFPAWPLGPLYNKATYSMAAFISRNARTGMYQRWKREADRLSSSAERPLRYAILASVSPVVAKRPDDWPAFAHLTGFWFMPVDQHPTIPDTLREFISGGPPPVCLGFGSMADDRPEELRAIVRGALDRVGARAVIVTGSGGALFGLGPHEKVCEVAFADYRWLFQRVAAVVHQGGIGTASHCLAAGVPQVIVGYCLDHRFWGWRMHEIGVAPRALSRHTLTSSSLANAIRRAVEDPGLRARATSLAQPIAGEDGVGIAVRIITEHCVSPAPG